MTRVFKVPPQFVDFLRTVQGTEGSRLNMDVQDINGNTIVGIEEWNAAELSWLHEQYSAESALFEEIEYEPKPIENPFI